MLKELQRLCKLMNIPVLRDAPVKLSGGSERLPIPSNITAMGGLV